MGFRHEHILEIHQKASQRQDCEIVGACEEHAPTAEKIGQKVKITHTNFAQLLEQTHCTILAVGDYFGRRGAILIEALKRGIHVVADKPICTSIEELNQIEQLAAKNNLTVGCQLSLPWNPQLALLTNLIREGTLGELHQIHFGGQHPLLWGTRPAWYFEPGKHGGTINDVGIHGIHALPEMTGLEFKKVIAARAWNAFADQAPGFMDSAQFMATMNNGCGVLADISYAMPDTIGYKLPQYWRFTVYGTKGMAEAMINEKQILLAVKGKKEAEKLTPAEKPADEYFSRFLIEIGEKNKPFMQSILKSTRVALRIQEAADQSRRDMDI
jgi:predicted dehydrogenase